MPQEVLVDCSNRRDGNQRFVVLIEDFDGPGSLTGQWYSSVHIGSMLRHQSFMPGTLVGRVVEVIGHLARVTVFHAVIIDDRMYLHDGGDEWIGYDHHQSRVRVMHNSDLECGFCHA